MSADISPDILARKLFGKIGAGQIEAAIKLIKDGANIYMLHEKSGETALEFARKKGSFAVVRAIEEKMAKNRAAGIEVATSSASPEQLSHRLFDIMKLILRGSDAKIPTAIELIRDGADFSLKNMDGYSILDIVLDKNIVPLLKAIDERMDIALSKGDIIISGNYIMYLINTKQFDRAAAFISNRSFTDVNYVNNMSAGKPSLLIQSLVEPLRIDIPTILLEKGATIELATTNNQTPLMHA